MNLKKGVNMYIIGSCLVTIGIIGLMNDRCCLGLVGSNSSSSFEIPNSR